MGKIKSTILLFLFSLSCHSQSAESTPEEKQILIEKKIANEVLNSSEFVSLPHKDKFDVISKDPKNIINDLFIIPKYFNSSVHFWFNIYTIYDSSFAVIHDKDNLGIIYKIMDYSSLSISKLNRYTKASLQKRYTSAKVKQLRKALKNLSRRKKIQV